MHCDSAGDITLSRVGKPRQSVHLLPVDKQSVDLRRRNFLIRFCQGAGATLIPASLWGFPRPKLFASPDLQPAGAEFHLHPHYRTQRPLDATLLKVQAGLDAFVAEKYADQIAEIFAGWSASLLQSPRQTQAIAKSLAPEFLGASLQPVESRVARASSTLHARQNKFAGQGSLDRDAFLREWESALSLFSTIVTAEFQITAIEVAGAASSPSRMQTRVLYEIAGTGAGFYRKQRVGNWEMVWEPSSSGEFRLRNWRALEETEAQSNSPVYRRHYCRDARR